jgi:hypothetical protein
MPRPPCCPPGFCRREGARFRRGCERVESLARGAKLLANALHARARGILLLHLGELSQDDAGVEIAHLVLRLDELLLAHGRHGLLSSLC